ncbi:MAG TPA: glycosyltransferase family A protein [Solirubrobacteraceae bacterium]|jgi:GT2 family glycosyltransferase
MSTETPPASIVIPTRARPAYLEVALSSIVPQARAVGAEVLVIDDAGASPQAREQARRLGARYEPHERELGLNVARNTGVQRSAGELVVFADDDIEAAPGWLAALLAAQREHPDVDVLAGRIRARLEGRAPHTCGREGPPITTLDLGERDTETRYAWGANMAIRRDALERIGPFDVSLEHGGDEQEWQDRLRAREPRARILYVARATVDHRRTGADARLRALLRTAYARGRAARRFDARNGRAPGAVGELETLAGCAWHVLRHRCPAGLTMVAHSAGRMRESRRGEHAPRATPVIPAADDFLSGQSGTVGGADAIVRGARDAAVDAWELASVRRLRLGLAARHAPPLRSVLAIGVVRDEHAALAAGVRAELESTRHELEFRTCPPGELGKFENLNRLLAERAGGSAIQEHDWLLVVDDDIDLPRGFLDRLLFLCERFDLKLAQPAHRARSHGAWPVTRRVPGSIVRETRFVEIGPVTAFARATFETLLPFPMPLRMGWGLDAHWAAIAREHGWRCGVLDAIAIAHRAAPAASAYSHAAAVSEAREFLADRPYLKASESQLTLTTHRRW